MRIGEIVEYLIGIKDRNKEVLTSDEIEAINNACNLLDHKFPRMGVAEVIINDNAT